MAKEKAGDYFMKIDNSPKCIECDNYWLLNQQCMITEEPRNPLDPQCGEEWARSSESPEVVKQKLFDLVFNLKDYVGGKYYSVVAICGARKGICLHNGECTFIKEGKPTDCEFKHKFENPEKLT